MHLLLSPIVFLFSSHLLVTVARKSTVVHYQTKILCGWLDVFTCSAMKLNFALSPQKNLSEANMKSGQLNSTVSHQ